MKKKPQKQIKTQDLKPKTDTKGGGGGQWSGRPGDNTPKPNRPSPAGGGNWGG